MFNAQYKPIEADVSPPSDLPRLIDASIGNADPPSNVTATSTETAVIRSHNLPVACRRQGCKKTRQKKDLYCPDSTGRGYCLKCCPEVLKECLHDLQAERQRNKQLAARLIEREALIEDLKSMEYHLTTELEMKTKSSNKMS